MSFQFEINPSEIRQRFWQIVPGLLSWTTLIGLSVLAFILPFWIAIFIIAYDVYILVRAVYMAVYLIYAHRRLRLMPGIDWLERCRSIGTDLSDYLQKLKVQLPQAQARQDTKTAWQQKQHIQEIKEIIQEKRPLLPWEKIHHLVVLPTYNESLTVLRHSLDALSQTDFPKSRLHIVIGFEERVGETARQKAKVLIEQYGRTFGTFLTTFHPDGLPGERRVKSANATWAILQLEKIVAEKHVDPKDCVVSNFDSDTVVPPVYFSYLTYVFITHPDRYRVSFQPIPVYHNNLWDAPSFSRVIATSSTFWQLIESTRPERLVTFSSHSMSLTALRAVGYWQKDVVSEDSRIFWQCLLRFDGKYRTVPLHMTVSMDAALADSWWRTLINQYKQKRRWAWGIENFPYVAEGFWRNRRIPISTKAIYLFRTLEGHYSWATASIIVAGLGWLPVLFGGPEFHTTVLSYSLPFMTRLLMSIAMSGLLISATISLMMMPVKPSRYGRWRYAAIFLQWVLVPLTATLLSAFPALDAETRLMLGRDLEFNVMQKSRRV